MLHMKFTSMTDVSGNGHYRSYLYHINTGILLTNPSLGHVDYVRYDMSRYININVGEEKKSKY